MKLLIRAVAFSAVVLLGSALGGSASARSLTTGPLVEHFDGTSWTQVTVRSIQYGLDAVVAPSATDVWAFGVSRVALHWDGTSWHRVKMPTPRHSAAPGFWGASAVSSHDIWAVGNVSPAHAPEHGIIDHWNGSRWQLAPFTVPRSELYGIDALSANDVWAVGDVSVRTAQGFERVGLTLHWNGSAWKQVPSPNPAPPTMAVTHVSNLLYAVSGSSSHDVWAVGQYNLWLNGTRGSRALVLHWDGARWKLVPSPSTVAGHVSFLYGVAAPSAGGAWAVGGTTGTTHSTRSPSVGTVRVGASCASTALTLPACPPSQRTTLGRRQARVPPQEPVASCTGTVICGPSRRSSTAGGGSARWRRSRRPTCGRSAGTSRPSR